MAKANCFAHHHMTPAEYGFWQLCRDLSAKKGILYFDGRNMVKRFAGTRRNGQSKDYFYGLLKGMTKKGWFETIEPRRRNKNSGLWMASMHRVLSHNEWVMKYGSDTCTEGPEADQSCPVITTGNESPVGISTQSGWDIGGVQSGYAPSPVRLSRHNPIRQSDVANPKRQPDAGPDGSSCLTIQTGVPLSAEHVPLEQPSVPPVSLSRQDTSPVITTGLPDAHTVPDGLAWHAEFKSWGARRDIGRELTGDEIAVMHRLNRERIRPEMIQQYHINPNG